MLYSVGWGTEIGVLGNREETAREALALAEEYIAAHRPNVTVTDLETGYKVTLDELRERAEAEAETETRRP
ncbi:MAG TPA: hypothetical protein VGL41_03920 [Roseiarcus sp.]|jgi:hypothetical protein